MANIRTEIYKQAGSNYKNKRDAQLRALDVSSLLTTQGVKHEVSVVGDDKNGYYVKAKIYGKEIER